MTRRNYRQQMALTLVFTALFAIWGTWSAIHHDIVGTVLGALLCSLWTYLAWSTRRHRVQAQAREARHRQWLDAEGEQ